MPGTVPSIAPLAADRAMTAERHELKYLVARADWHALSELLNRKLPSHRFRGEGGNPLPSPEHFVTTIYFDTKSRTLLDEACHNLDENVKLRAKEYYDLHPSLAELATSPDEVLHQTGELWLELKRRSGTRTFKHRISLTRAALGDFIGGRGGKLPKSYVGSAEDAEVIREYFGSFDEPLSPSCLVNYKRRSWQSEDGQLRVTLDLDLAFYAAPEGIWQPRALVRSVLGRACAHEYHALLEVKQRSLQPPDWLAALVNSSHLEEVAYSKFVRASRAVWPDA